MVKMTYCFWSPRDLDSFFVSIIYLVSWSIEWWIPPSLFLLLCPLLFRHQLLTVWSRSLWEWTALCQEGRPPLWPSMLWPTRYSVIKVCFYLCLNSQVLCKNKTKHKGAGIKGLFQQTYISGCNAYLFCLLISVVRMWFLTCLHMSYWGGRNCRKKYLAPYKH